MEESCENFASREQKKLNIDGGSGNGPLQPPRAAFPPGLALGLARLD